MNVGTRRHGTVHTIEVLTTGGQVKIFREKTFQDPKQVKKTEKEKLNPIICKLTIDCKQE